MNRLKAIILCAGKSIRMHPLTITRPKPLLKILNKTIIEHTLLALKGLVSEAILVVGYKKEMIEQAIGNNFQGIKITYVEQKEQLGTGHAVLCAKKYIKCQKSKISEHDQKQKKFLTKDEKFLIIPGDDLFSKKDIKNSLKHNLCILVKEVNDPEKWGIVSFGNDLYMTGIEEKPKIPKSALASTGLMVMNYELINILEKEEKTKRGEIEIPSALNKLSKKEKIYCQKVEDYWLPIGYPWHILEANEFLLSKLKKNDIKGKIGKNVHIDGKIVLGKNSEILPGTYIEGNIFIGENTKIGPNSYIRGSTTIGDNSKIGQGVEVKNSVIGDGSKVPHLSYVGDSIIGENCNLGAGTIVANLRHNHLHVKTSIKDELVSTGRKKFGTVIGDNVHTGINTAIYPGRKIWPNLTTNPGEIILKDKVN